jgi:hypothetical protein
MKPVIAHGAVLALSAVLAFGVWSKSGETRANQGESSVEVWSGRPDSLESISFESATRKVKLEVKKDASGRYFVGSVDKEATTSPHAHPPGEAHSDDEKPAEKKRESVRFVSVKAGDELAQKLAPLLALRSVGKIEAGRNEEFGFDKPEGTLKVKIGGKEELLVIGSATPGGQERYAKHGKSGTVYAVPGDIAQNMLFAESRLIERELHGFADTEVTRVRISKAGKSREALRIPEKKDGWADPANPSKLEESIGNYMTKVGRLRVMEYVETPSAPLKPEDALVRVDYFGGNKELGYVELFKVPGEKGNDYLARSEYGRWYVKVPQSAGEQVEQDASGVVK